VVNDQVATAAGAATPRPSVQQVWAWLADIEDPEIPVISIVDLGIVRDVRWLDDAEGGELVVTVTPTYSGCPATHVIAERVVDALRDRGVQRVRLENRIAPPWTTDWMSEEGKRKLREYGIAPPVGRAGEQAVAVESIGRAGQRQAPGVSCPRCGSLDVRLTSQFGSTPCKALYRCAACSEPFDYFKCH
jgi:ring-1,2-phenylacetyl-CoA epoxidase subunit PaaD